MTGGEPDGQGCHRDDSRSEARRDAESRSLEASNLAQELTSNGRTHQMPAEYSDSATHEASALYRLCILKTGIFDPLIIPELHMADANSRVPELA